MDTQEPEFHSGAEDDIAEALDWYAGRNFAAARSFLTEVEATVDRIVTAPKRWPAGAKGTRRLGVKRFPYVVHNRLKDERVEILAVAHGSRRPRYWRDRLQG